MKLKILYIFFLIINISFSLSKQNLELDDEIKNWIEKNKDKEIKVYITEDLGVLNYNVKGENKGVFPEIIEILRENTNLNFKIITESQLEFEKSIDSEIPDLILGVEEYKRNAIYYKYLDKPLALEGAMISRIDYPAINKILEENNNINKIVYLKDHKIKYKILKKYKDDENIKLIEENNKKGAINLILTKKADLFIDDFSEGLKYIVENPNLKIKINNTSEELSTSYYIGAKEEYKILLDIINIAFKNNLLGKEFVEKEVLSYVKEKSKKSVKAKKYLSRLNKIKIYIPENEDSPRLYKKDKDGKETGFLVNYFKDLGIIIGTDIVFKRGKALEDADIDPFVLSVNGNILNGKDLNVLTPYVELELYIFNREENGYKSGITLDEEEKIAVVEGGIIEKYLIYKGLEKKIVRYKTFEEVLKSVEEGDTDILIGTLQHFNYGIRKYNIDDLKVAGSTGDHFSLSFGIPKNDKELFILLNAFNRDLFYALEPEKEIFINGKLQMTKDYKMSILILILSIIVFYILYRHLKNVRKTNEKLKKLTVGLVATLEDANTFNDEDTGVHIERVNKYSMILAKELKLEKRVVDIIGLYASLHDIGKIGIEDKILKKHGNLTDKEFAIMKKHVEIGYNLIKNLEIDPIVENMIRYHHEKWDGSGYNKGLKGEEIPIEARIVALADVYDALRQKRVYKDGFSHEKAMDIIKNESGKHFDPKLVGIFIEQNKEFKLIFDKSLVL